MNIFDLGKQLHYLKPLFLEAIEGVISSGQIIHGENCRLFEKEFAAFLEVDHVVGMGNCTDALEIAMRILHPEGMEDSPLRLLVQANMGGYASVAAAHLNAEVCYVDVDDEHGQMKMETLLYLLSEFRPHITIVTHAYGAIHPHIEEIAAKTCVIEDFSHAHGASLRGRKAGSFGLLGCCSFYPTKVLGALGDGGALVTSSETIARFARRLAMYGWNPRHTISEPRGRNSRLDEIQAAVLRVRLPYLAIEANARRRVALRYEKEIRHPQIRVPKRALDESDVFHLFYVLLPDHKARLSFEAHLQGEGIIPSVRYPVPDHLQPGLSHRSLASLRGTARWSDSVICLPMHSHLSDEEVSQVIEAVNSWRQL